MPLTVTLRYVEGLLTIWAAPWPSVETTESRDLRTRTPMATGDPDTSMLSRLLRSRLAAGLNPLTGKRRTGDGTEPPTPDERSSAVIGSLLKDARDAYSAGNTTRRAPDPDPVQPSRVSADTAARPNPDAAAAFTDDIAEAPATPCAGHIQSAADTHAQMNDTATDPGDLSAFVLETLNSLDWDDWVTARCDFPQAGPFVVSGSSAALEAMAEIIDALIADACDDGDDLTVSIYTAQEGGSARITVTGPFNLSLDTLGLIKRHRRRFESTGGAIYTVRTLGTAGFEALIPGR